MVQSQNNSSQAKFGQILSFFFSVWIIFFSPWLIKFQDEGHATDIIEFDFYKAFDKITILFKIVNSMTGFQRK